MSSEEFTNDFINMIRDGKQDGFRRRYRDVDVLLVDDIQFLENKEGTQEEFFHTFNTLHNASKQIVISSDRAPKRLVTLEDRLRSRFEWGLLTDVQPPELETRIAILRKKAVQDRLNAPPEALEYIASRISTNIRELEGALIRVTAFASLNRQSVDLQLAEFVLKDLIPEAHGPEITAATIMGQTAVVLRPVHRGPVRHVPVPGAGHRPADRHVPVPRAHRPVAAEDRPAVRRPRPHHRHARRPQDPVADGRAPVDLQPGHRADQPDQAAGAVGRDRVGDQYLSTGSIHCPPDQRCTTLQFDTTTKFGRTAHRHTQAVDESVDEPWDSRRIIPANPGATQRCPAGNGRVSTAPAAAVPGLGAPCGRDSPG